MGVQGALFAMAGAQAVGQVAAGYAAEAEAKYNASVLDAQRMLTGVEQDIEVGRYQRLKGKQLSKSMSSMAGMGIMPQGSAMAAVVNAQTQINIDQAITKFNYEREKSYIQSQSDAEIRRGKSARRAGWSNAFSTMLKAGSNYAMYNRGLPQQRSSTFDTNVSASTAKYKQLSYTKRKNILYRNYTVI